MLGYYVVAKSSSKQVSVWMSFHSGHKIIILEAIGWNMNAMSGWLKPLVEFQCLDGMIGI